MNIMVDFSQNLGKLRLAGGVLAFAAVAFISGCVDSPGPNAIKNEKNGRDNYLVEQTSNPSQIVVYPYSPRKFYNPDWNGVFTGINDLKVWCKVIDVADRGDLNLFERFLLGMRRPPQIVVVEDYTCFERVKIAFSKAYRFWFFSDYEYPNT